METFPCYWPYVRGIHRRPVNSTHNGQWRGALMFSLICALNKRLSKQSWGWWFETPSRSLWRHCIAYRLLRHISTENTVYQEMFGGDEIAFISCYLRYRTFHANNAILILKKSPFGNRDLHVVTLMQAIYESSLVNIRCSKFSPYDVGPGLFRK